MRDKFKFPEDAVQEILAFIRRDGLFTTPRPVACTIPDPGDLPFIEVSLHAGVPIVTGNIRHFRRSGTVILTPAAFLAEFRERSGLVLYWNREYWDRERMSVEERFGLPLCLTRAGSSEKPNYPARPTIPYE